MTATETDNLLLTASEVAIEAAGGERKLPRINMLAYGGGVWQSVELLWLARAASRRDDAGRGVCGEAGGRADRGGPMRRGLLFGGQLQRGKHSPLRGHRRRQWRRQARLRRRLPERSRQD